MLLEVGQFKRSCDLEGDLRSKVKSQYWEVCPLISSASLRAAEKENTGLPQSEGSQASLRGNKGVDPSFPLGQCGSQPS